MDDADLLSEARRRLPAARTAIHRHIGNIPAAGGGTRASGTSDRTGSIACKLATAIDADQAWRDDAELDRLELQAIARLQAGTSITRTLQDILRIVDRWAPDPKRKQVLEDGLRAAANDDLNYRGDINNCDSCRRDPGSYGEPFRRGLCVNCYRRVARIVELYDVDITMPPVDLVRLFRERGKVTDHDIHRVMAGQPRRA